MQKLGEQGNSTSSLTIEKMSNPESGEGEADGLLPGGDREASYAWAMAARGDYLYIGTNRNIVGSVAETFVQAMGSAGVNEDIAWGLINSMTNNEIPRPESDEGGSIFKFNMETQEMKVIYTAEKNVAFRNAVEFEGNLYFASYSSDTTADNYIYKIDSEDKITVAFTSESGTSLRASCEYDGALLFGGVDARQESDEGDEDYQKLAIVKKDANNDTKWDRIADYKDFGEYSADPAVFSNVTSPIWDMCTYNGYIYATIPNSNGIAMFKGHPAEGEETPNEYGWYWSEVIGKNNGVNNLGMADSPEGYTGDEAGMITMAATPFTFKGKLYLMNFDNTISSEVYALTGLVSALAGQDVKARDYLKPMYTTLTHPQKLWCYDDNTGKFNEVEGFTKYMENNCIEYVWRTETYNDELYITTMDSAVLYNYITNLKGDNFAQLNETDIETINQKIDELLDMISSVGGGSSQIEELTNLLENFKSLVAEYQQVANDNVQFKEFVIENEELINQIYELGTGDNPTIEIVGQEFVDLYNKVDWEGLKMYAYIAKTIENDVWGFDLLKSSDGENFELVTDSGFNDKYNYGGRSLLATDNGLYVGTANPFYGAQLWKISTTDEEEPGGEEPGGEEPGGEQPGGEQPGGEQPGGEEPGGEQPGGEEPGGEQPGGEEPGEEQPGGEQPGGDNQQPDDNNDQNNYEDQFKDSIENPDNLNNELNDLNNSYDITGKDYPANSQLPATGRNYSPILICVGLLVVAITGFKYFRYKNIDKH